MAEQPPTRDTITPLPEGRKPWSAPKLLEYGHIGKLTQTGSGNMGDGGFKRNCL